MYPVAVLSHFALTHPYFSSLSPRNLTDTLAVLAEVPHLPTLQPVRLFNAFFLFSAGQSKALSRVLH